ERHLAWAIECRERTNCSSELHAIVRRLRLSTAQLLLMLPCDQHRAPTARARISSAGAIGVDGDGCAASSGWTLTAGGWSFRHDRKRVLFCCCERERGDRVSAQSR